MLVRVSTEDMEIHSPQTSKTYIREKLTFCKNKFYITHIEMMQEMVKKRRF